MSLSLGYLSDQLYKVELDKIEKENGGPLFVSFLHYAIIRTSEPY